MSLLPSSTAAAKPLYQCALGADPQAAGWRFIAAAESREELEFVPSEGYYRSKGGRLQSPAIPCVAEEFSFYRLRFQARFSEKGYYAVCFQNTAGKDQADDIYGSVDPATQWLDQDYCFRGREQAKSFHLNFISHGTLTVRNILVEQVDCQAVGAWADRLYATLPRLDHHHPDNREKHLPRTWQRLRDGGTLRVVMLGDSIINDTNNSNWDALVMRQYPACRIQVVTSVRGSTGCWYYRDPQPFKSYVADRRPELLLIGGISHQQDLEAIREVLRQAKTTLTCEILLLSGPVGADWRPHDPAQPAAALPPIVYAGDAFNLRLATLAEEMDVAFLDMNTSWHRYLGASGKPWEYFHRDAVHANDRGKQILARLLEHYFAPTA